MLLDDFLSRDAGRVLDASAAVVHLTDGAELGALARRLPDIEARTRGLMFGGELFDNDQHLRQALLTLNAWREGACRCSLYPGDYPFYDPEREARDGHVEITWHSAPDWNMTFHARCLRCAKTYEVEQGEYHYTWWKWQKLAAG